MSEARDEQQVLARFKNAVHSDYKRHTAAEASNQEIALDVRKGPPSGYTPLFPPAEVLGNAQNVNRRICYFLFVICYFISSLTRANLCMLFRRRTEKSGFTVARSATTSRAWRIYRAHLLTLAFFIGSLFLAELPGVGNLLDQYLTNPGAFQNGKGTGAFISSRTFPV